MYMESVASVIYLLLCYLLPPKGAVGLHGAIRPDVLDRSCSWQLRRAEGTESHGSPRGAAKGPWAAVMTSTARKCPGLGWWGGAWWAWAGGQHCREVVYAPCALVLSMAEGIRSSGSGMSLSCVLPPALCTTRPWHDEVRFMQEGEAALMVGHWCPEDSSKSPAGKLCSQRSSAIRQA